MSDPIILLAADANVDLAPLTEKLWSEQVPHRVMENDNGQQVLVLGNPHDAGRVSDWVEQWRAGTLHVAKASVRRRTILRTVLAKLLLTPFTSFGVALFVGVFVWMHFSDGWVDWMQNGRDLWPDERFSLGTYWQLGLWGIWRPTLLHLSLVHLLFNLTMWWALGWRIERADGASRLLLLLVVAGAFGNALQWFLNGPAFGGVSGVTSAMVGWVGWRQIQKKADYQMPTVLLPVMAGWLLLTITADTLVPGLTHMAHGAHLGGVCVGLAMAMLASKAQTSSPHNDNT